MGKSFVESTLCQEDASFELSLRPQALHEFTGQEPVKARLEVAIGAALLRKEALGHCLLSGPPGLGKTTLATILAKAMGTNLVVTSGPAIEKPGDLAGVLTNLKAGDIFFVDELHQLNRIVEEYLYSAMEDFVLDLIIDSGPSSRSVQVKLNRFTFIGATTRVGLLSAPLRSRFAFSCRLDYYPSSVLEKILLRSSRILNIPLDSASAEEIAKRSRGTPRIANNLLRWVRDYVQIRTKGEVNQQVVDDALKMLAIDHQGLDEMDKRLLEVIIHHYNGGPVGLNTLAIALGEEGHTLEEVYEPYLIQQGFLKRTSRGREVTALAYEHLGVKPIKTPIDNC